MKIILAVNTFSSFLSHRRALYLKLKEKHDVEVILPDSEDPKVVHKDLPPASWLKIALSRKGVHPFQEFLTILAFYRYYRRDQPELVHHFTIKPVIYGTLAARWAGVPRIVNTITGMGYVFTAKSSQAKVLGWLIRHLYRLCFASPKVKVIFQNQDDFDFFIQNGILQRNQAFLVEGSGVDIQKFTPPTDLQTRVPRILLAARLLVEKGIFEFMEAVQILKAKGLQFEALVAGNSDPGNPGSVSEEQIQAWRQSDLATFLGFQQDMVSLLNSVDIACLPSYREGVPMSLLEAMAAGKPIVTTDAPGCRVTVQNERNGYLVPPRDGTLLARALEKLILDPQLRQKMGQESRQMAVGCFSQEKILSEILKIYHS